MNNSSRAQVCGERMTPGVLGAAWAPRQLTPCGSRHRTLSCWPCGRGQPCQPPLPRARRRVKGLLCWVLIAPSTRHYLATEKWRAALALHLPWAKLNALKRDIELWELLSVVLTFSCVSAPVKGNIYSSKEVSGILCMGVLS